MQTAIKIASVISALFLLGMIAVSQHQRGTELEQMRDDLEKTRVASETATRELASLQEEIKTGKQTIQQLQVEKAEATRAQQNLEKEMRTALQSRDVTISELQGKLSVNILDRVLFDSGEAVLKPEGEAVLAQVGKVLSQYPKRQIQVIGHTDNVPIRGNFNRYADNWELSVGRALAAVRFLAEKGTVDPQRLGAVGYGEYHPVANNATPEGRAKNRRITLVVLPEELAAIEPFVSENSTNAPAASTPPPVTRPVRRPLE
jgi:chemotaxis protein MotB